MEFGAGDHQQSNRIWINNLVKLYESIMVYAQKQLHTDIDMVWAPIVLLLIIYVLLGMGTAIAGISIGKRLESADLMPQPINDKNTPRHANSQIFTFSLLHHLADFRPVGCRCRTCHGQLHTCRILVRHEHCRYRKLDHALQSAALRRLALTLPVDFVFPYYGDCRCGFFAVSRRGIIR